MEIVERRERLRPPAPQPVPWLVFSHGKGGKNQMFFNILEQDKNYSRSIPEMRQKFIHASQHDWLVMSDRNFEEHCFLWNPVSLETVQLPPLKVEYNLWTLKSKYDQGGTTCILTAPPNDPNCMILFWNMCTTFFLFCRLGEEQWTKQYYKLEDGDNHTLRRAISCSDGNIYALTLQGKLAVIDQVPPGRLSVRILEVEPAKSPTMTEALDKYLVESCGEIFLVMGIYTGFILEEASNIEVFRMDFSSMVWAKVQSIGDNVFFLGDEFCLSCSTVDSKVKGNCIYFTQTNDKSLYTFTLQDKSISVSLPCPNLSTPWFSLGWIMPVHRSAVTSIEHAQRIPKEKNTKVKDTQKAIIREEEVEKRVVEGRAWSEVPNDLLKLITRHLLLADYMQFSLVCKTWRLAALPTKWNNALIESSTQCSWLMSIQTEMGKCSFFDPTSSMTYFMDVPDLSGATICFSKDGWLLISQGLHSVFFFNPFTKARIELPDLNTNYFFKGISFSSSPTSPDCVVFGINNNFPEWIEIGVCRRGDKSWTVFNLRSNLHFLTSFNNPVFYNGSFYCLGQEGNLGVFDPNEGQFTILRNPQKPCTSTRQNFLVECNGDLLSVFVGHLAKWVRIFRLDHSIMVWKETKCLEDHTLFVSRVASLTKTEMTKKWGMENKVYFPRFRGKEGVSYTLGACSNDFSESEKPNLNFYGTKEPVHCAWIEPRWPRPCCEELNWLV
ncbi:hypothetical protein HHK36_019743 [Tetracentron sinense]|uniref:F-box domain-containing protein n=1 Tax=Tetracentron sinense TaxID=13715 RepID=A0A835DCK2_TETSI|nr:hypothetical protein HHK36_019743 [Tetracentron sinense]